MSTPPQPRLASSTTVSRMASLSALALVLGGAASSATAQPSDPDGPEGNRWGLGVGVINKQDPYTGMDRETKALPIIRFENKYVKVALPSMELKLPGVALGDAGNLNFSVLGKLELGGYKPGDAPILAGMTERKGGFWAGAKAEWENDFVDLNAQWLADASSNSKGQRFSFGLEKKWHLGQHVMLMPHLTAHWLDKKYVDYYYGVRADEVTAGRAAYTGKSGVNVELGLRAMYLVDRNHSLMLDVSATSLAKGVKDSSLVDRSSTNRVILGYLYSF